MSQAPLHIEEQLVEDMGRFTHDPLGYVLYAFEWGVGELERHPGPRAWQRAYLEDLGRALQGLTGPEHTKAVVEAISAIRRGTASGHGIGKSALVSLIVMWAMSTCEDTRAIITANTESQLKIKTWAELSKWHRLAINRHWFTFTATAMYSSDPFHEKTWRADMVPWSENKPEAFAGLHNQGKRILIIFDEASAIANVIWDVTEGAMTDADTEILWCVFGNPTRNTGKFHDIMGAGRGRWQTQSIDSRTVEGTNKAELDAWVEEYGEDSDFVRVRVRGMFPRASALQFIASDIVTVARKREAMPLLGDPLIMALDIARGGADNCVFRFRKGRDARTIPPVRVPGSEVRDSMRLVAMAVDLIERYKPDAFMFDGTGVGGPVGDRIRQLGHAVFEVQFGAASPNPKQANFRAYMWQRMKEWLQDGGAIDDDNILDVDLTAPEYTHNTKGQLLLEPKDAMKKRGLASPDDGDALAMTFAFNVAPLSGPGVTGVSAAKRGKLETDWDPLESLT